MPNYFTLTKKGEEKYSSFFDIDTEMREAFGEPSSETVWLDGWYDVIGLGLAMGYSWDKMREYLKGDMTLKILDYLEKNYDANAWSQVGGRRR